MNEGSVFDSLLGWQLYCHPGLTGAAVQLPHQPSFPSVRQRNYRTGGDPIFCTLTSSYGGSLSSRGGVKGILVRPLQRVGGRGRRQFILGDRTDH
jgi:hypothetical protein